MTPQPNNVSIFLNSTHPPSKQGNSQSWLAILTCGILTLVLMVVPAGNLGKIIVPVAVVATGFLLYVKNSIMYMAFTWWIWFLAPLVSRVIEYRSGIAAEDLRLIIVAPYLVSFISIEMLLKKILRFSQLGGLPFLLAGISIVYASLIGLIRGYPLVQIGQEFLSWGAPICFGFFMLVNWTRYESYKRAMQITFLWITFLIGTYGIFQFLAPLPWDVFWWENATNVKDASGIAAPKLVRVWSTLNTTFIFGYAIAACICVTLSWSRMISIPVLISGLISLLLSQVRVAWIALAITLFLFSISTHPRVSQRSLFAIIVAIILTIPLAFHPDFSEVITDRVSSLSQGEKDGSLQERQKIYEATLQQAFNPIGKGLGAPKIIDAGAVDVISTLGLIGTFPILLSVGLAFSQLFKKIYRDSFRTILQSIAVAFFSTIAFNNIFILLPGQIFWSFIGLAFAADRYHSAKRLESDRLRSQTN
jgi:hypothetical protein